MKRAAIVRRAAAVARSVLTVNANPAEFVREFVKAGGLVLNREFWKIGAEEALLSEIENAITKGWSASKATAEFVYSGRVHDFVQSNVDISEYSDGIDHIGEIFHTEINRALGERFMSGGEGTLGFAGWRYLLSPRHPDPDICDLLVTQNPYGLGPGVYPDRERTPWPAHQGTLSFVEMVFDDEVTAVDRAGRETELQALARLAPEIRAGVLGQTKAAYFEKDLLRRWMIRSSTEAVTRRLVRQGLLPV
jgi:hypothetical protein